MSELLPCPFCGGEAEHDDYLDVAHIYCIECGVMLPTEKQWNTRTPSIEDIVAAVEALPYRGGVSGKKTYPKMYDEDDVIAAIRAMYK